MAAPRRKPLQKCRASLADFDRLGQDSDLVGFAAGIPLLFGIALVLGSAWALVPALLGAIDPVVRTALEDDFLVRTAGSRARALAALSFRPSPVRQIGRGTSQEDDSPRGQGDNRIRRV